MSRVIRLTQTTIAVNLGVILLGALVRATGSGAGCGSSWPTCRGELVPALEGATAIEAVHRFASGIALLLVGILIWAVFSSTEAGHRARKGAVWSGVAIAGEALIGAMIVLFEWVADDASVARVVSVPLHLVNTLLLLAAITLTWFWLAGGGPLNKQPGLAAVVTVGCGMLILGATGAVTALADTLFPKTYAAGLSSGEHFLTRLRLIHPFAAVVVAAAAAWWAARAIPRLETRSRVVARAVILLLLLQMLAGVVNVWLGAPLWLQLVHLGLADLLWIAWVWLGASVLAPRFAGRLSE